LRYLPATGRLGIAGGPIERGESLNILPATFIIAPNGVDVRREQIYLPDEMVVAMAGIFNGGTVVRPRIVFTSIRNSYPSPINAILLYDLQYGWPDTPPADFIFADIIMTKR
jgi:hypothetical protein